MIRIARYSSRRSSLLAMSVTAGFVLALFVATLLTHLPDAEPKHAGAENHPTTVHTENNGVPTRSDNLHFISKVLRP